MENKFKEFWIEEFVGNNFLRAYRSKPNFSPIKIQINKGPDVDGYIYYHLIEYAALESANADIETLKQLFAIQLDVMEQNKKLRAALESISKNSCCDTCQQAKLVALSALGNLK